MRAGALQFGPSVARRLLQVVERCQVKCFSLPLLQRQATTIRRDPPAADCGGRTGNDVRLSGASCRPKAGSQRLREVARLRLQLSYSVRPNVVSAKVRPQIRLPPRAGAQPAPVTRELPVRRANVSRDELGTEVLSCATRIYSQNISLSARIFVAVLFGTLLMVMPKRSQRF